MEFLQHIADKATSDCGVAFGVLFAVIIGLLAGLKIILNMWGTDRKNLLDTINKTQENITHAGENMEKIVLALASRRSTGDS